MTKGLHTPIHREIDGEQHVLLTSGHVCRVMGRSQGTIRYWQKQGIFPFPPFVMNVDRPSARRWLYDQRFVKRLEVIAKNEYLYPRLERADWPRFYEDVRLAYEETITPRVTVGVTEDAPSKPDGETPLGKCR